MLLALSFEIMSRSKRFVTGLVSSYATIGVNIAYTLASVPLVLHYLGKEEFGLWALVTQLSGYLMLLEFGMTGSVARFLADHKDDVNGGDYGDILRTGARVFVIQGFLVAMLGCLVAWFAVGMLDLPTSLQTTFSILYSAQAILSGMKIAAGTLITPLWAHQRLDISSLGGSISLVATFIALWLGLHAGWQLLSMPVAASTGFTTSLGFCYFSCRRLRLYPERKARGRFNKTLFRQMSGFGGGIFLMNIGAQLASASQVVLASRMLGLEGASVWSIATKVSSLAQQFVGKILESSAGGLSEMVARGERDRLRHRFHDVVSLTAVLAVSAAAGIAFMNEPFMDLWTGGRISWPSANNLLLAAVIVVTSVTKCHIGLVGVTKHIGGMKFVYLGEGLAFVSLAAALLPHFGLAGLLVATLCCNLLICGTYGTWRTACYFHLPPSHTAAWGGRPALLFILIVLIFLLLNQPVVADLDAIRRFTIGGLAFAFGFLPALWMLGIPKSSRREMTAAALTIPSRIHAGLRSKPVK